jgi:hypothetical protein
MMARIGVLEALHRNVVNYGASAFNGSSWHSPRTAAEAARARRIQRKAIPRLKRDEIRLDQVNP